LSYFLIVYDQAAGAVRDLIEYPEHLRGTALDRRFELEHEFRHDPSVEIVVLGAETRADLESTHSRYFKSIRELAEGT
jgi:hypothetical protein